MSEKTMTILIVVTVLSFLVWFTILLTPKYQMTEVKIVKIHTVEDYAKEKELSSMNASFPHVIYEVVATGERFLDRNVKGELGEVIIINRQIGGMR